MNLETKTIGGRIVEVKESVNGQDVGVFIGYIATFDIDEGSSFAVPDRFVAGAFLNSLQEHRARGNRQIRLKDHHGRTIGGFPIELAREDEVGLIAEGHINLELQDGREAFSLMKQRVLTDLSIGFSSIEDKVESGVREIFEAIVWEGSIVDEPMNRAARILEVKSVAQFQDLPLAEREHPWDAEEAKERVGEDEVEKSIVFAGLPIADLVEGKLTAIPAAIFAAAEKLKTDTNLPAATRAAAIRHLERYYRKMDVSSPFDVEERQFFGIDEVQAFGVPELREALQKSGAFTKGAARYLAGALTKPGQSAYSSSEDQKGLSLILRDLNESRDSLR